MFENMVLRRIFEAKRDEITEEWRRLHNKEPNDLYSSSYIIQMIKSRKLRWVGHVAHMVEGRKGEGHTGLWLKSEGKDHLEDPGHRWEDNIKMDLQVARLGGIDWIAMTQKRDRWQAPVNAVKNLQVQ